MAHRKIAGIYKITSPSGKVYIGQSYSIKSRWRDHNHMAKSKSNTILSKSIRKYGFACHAFEIIHYLPQDVDTNTMTIYEQFYIDQYISCGVKLLNICPAGGSCKGRIASEETRRKISESNKGKPPLVFTDEIRAKISNALKGNKHTLGKKYPPEHGKKISERQIGKQGKIPSAETRQKMSIARTGKKFGKMSDAHKAALSKALKGTKASVGRVLSQETKNKIAASLLGRPSIFIGIKNSDRVKKSTA